MSSIFLISGTYTRRDTDNVVLGIKGQHVVVSVIFQRGNQCVQMLRCIVSRRDMAIAVRTLQQLQALKCVSVETVSLLSTGQSTTREGTLRRGTRALYSQIVPGHPRERWVLRLMMLQIE
jgi:hypothetical protein